MRLALFVMALAISFFAKAQFSEPSQILHSSWGDQFYTDVDNNGEIDLIISNYQGQVMIKYNCLLPDQTYFGQIPGLPILYDIGYLNDDDLIDFLGHSNEGPMVAFNNGSNEWELSPLFWNNYAYNIEDINGDGFEDLTSPGLIQYNDGFGEFTVSSIPGVGKVTFGDVNNDNNKDMIRWSPEEIMIYLSDGEENFSLETSLAYPSFANNQTLFQVLDVDENGWNDIVFQEGDSLVTFSNESMAFTQIVVSHPELDNSQIELFIGEKIELADFDEDGDEDIIVVSSSTNEINVFDNIDNAGFADTPLLVYSSTYPIQTMEFTDINGDGFKDFITYFENELSFLSLNNGDNTFTDGEIFNFEVANAPYKGTTLIDPNNLNDDQLIWVNHNLNTGDWSLNSMEISNNIEIYNSPRKTALNPLLNDSENDNTSHLKVADFNGDSFEDFAFYVDGKVSVNLNDGSGNFIESDYFETIEGFWASIHVADLNNDNIVDIVVGPSLNYFINDGSGQFTLDIGTQDILDFNGIIDFNGDGLTDLLGSTLIHINNGDLTFSEIEHMAYPGQGQAVDWDNDGDEDYITFGADAISFAQNTGDNFIYSDEIVNLGTGRYTIFDADNDGDQDFAYHQTNGDALMLHLFNGTDFGNGIFIDSLMAESGAQGVFNTDYDNDGDQDLLVRNRGEIFLYQNSTVNTYGISGSIFYDQNENGTKELEEPYIDMAGVTLSPLELSYYSDDSGAFQYSLGFAGAYELSSLFMPDNWELTTPGTFDIEISDFDPISQDNHFGYSPIVDGANAMLDWVQIGGQCDELVLGQLQVENVGSTVLSGQISLELDPLFVYEAAFDQLGNPISPSDITGNVYTFDFSDLGYFQEFIIQVQYLHPDFTAIGEIAENIVTLTTDDSEVFTDSFSQEILCAYDPNDKQVEPAGFSDSGYILNNQTMEYTVRFQNTGNAPATTVEITDELSAMLDHSSLTPLAWSHDFSLIVDENDVAHFLFENIMLPDSGADFLASQGFVKFSMDQVPDLEPGIMIENTANIYFDNNPAVITNTVLNTIYTCDWLYETPVIEGEQFLSTDEGALSYQWYFEGNLLEGETTSSIDAFDYGVGVYTVVTSQPGDCLLESDEYVADWSSVEEQIASSVDIYPNPVLDLLSIVYDGSHGEIRNIQILNLQGKVVLEENVILSNSNKLDASNLAKGSYFIRIQIGDNTISKMITKQ